MDVVKADVSYESCINVPRGHLIARSANTLVKDNPHKHNTYSEQQNRHAAAAAWRSIRSFTGNETATQQYIRGYLHPPSTALSKLPIAGQ